MYFYIHKTNKNEQTQLLEMCSDACFRSGNGKCIQRITKKYTS